MTKIRISALKLPGVRRLSKTKRLALGLSIALVPLIAGLLILTRAPKPQAPALTARESQDQSERESAEDPEPKPPLEPRPAQPAEPRPAPHVQPQETVAAEPKRPAPRTTRSRKKRPRRTARRAPGSLSVQTHPWTEVLLGKRKLGQTPVEGLELPSGQHTLTLRNSKLGIEKEIRVTIRPGKVTRIVRTF